jgi:glutamine amidotransferase-like uncharacterized protein
MADGVAQGKGPEFKPQHRKKKKKKKKKKEKEKLQKNEVIRTSQKRLLVDN